MEVKKMSSKLIKPFTATPLNLKNCKISFIDLCLPPRNVAVVLFYESKPESSRRLEESLAETLVQFYPLAGRFIKKLNSVDCSDQGAEFVEAEALGFDLVSIIGADQHNDLLPDQFFQLDESATQPLLSIQATRFTCGGMALAVSVSHRVFDASSLATFIAAWSWSSTATNPTKTVTAPSFDLPSLFPIADDSDVAVNFNSHTFNNSDNVVVKKLQFDMASIARLKSKIGKPVSAARAVTAVISKALILLDGVRRGGKSRGFVVFQPVNMRERTTAPHVAKHACGNFSLFALSRRVDASEAEGVGIAELSELIGEAARRYIGDYAEAMAAADRDVRDLITNTLDKLADAFRDPDTNVLVFSDLSKFGMYEVDFGWGKPAWMSNGPQNTTNMAAVLMSKRDGDGIEAWLRVNKKSCFDFQKDWEFINQVICNLA